MLVRKNFLVAIINEETRKTYTTGMAESKRGIEQIIDDFKTDTEYIYCLDDGVQNLVYRDLQDMANLDKTSIPHETREHDDDGNVTHRTPIKVKIICFTVRQ